MNEDRGLPAYPPERNAWEFPPPPISPRWRWAPIVAVVLAASIGIALAITAVTVMDKDFPGIIQDDRIVTVIDRECEIMTETVRSMPVSGTPSEQADIVRDQDQAITNMLAEIRRIGADVLRGDPPTTTWLDDWDALVAAREAFAEQLDEGFETSLRIPRDSHGDRIHERMDLVWLTSTVCEVPEELLNPYPEDVSSV